MTDSLAVRIVLVAAAGGCGALARWGLAAGTQSLLGDRWPWGTLLVNVLGCFAFGVILAICHRRGEDGEFMKLLLLTGFAGALTTYSTFAFESYDLATTRSVFSAAWHIALHLALGILAMAAGIAVAGGLDAKGV
ncbi:MAG: CrcB family protein [Pirellulales bacterium]|nr:CrcB family protein [Pirellulales bacterium]